MKKLLSSMEMANITETSSKAPLSTVFTTRYGTEYNELYIFLTHFNRIPNIISERDLDCKKANDWFKAEYQNRIKDFFFTKRYYGKNKNAQVDDIFYFLSEDLLINFDTNNSTIRFLFKKTPLIEVEELATKLKKFKLRKSAAKPKISLLVNSNGGITTKQLEITKTRLNIHKNYNDDFPEIHKTIFKRLSRSNDKGLVLLHGKPGTGKTSYIRYLISLLKKPVIFLPPNMASEITNPNLISILIENPNSIFVIEDAENIVVDRERAGNSPVSALLNISDGLLSDCLNIQIICSFNTDISKVDSALLRKGRLIARYEFKDLQIRKAQALSDGLGYHSTISRSMNLSSIYNQNEMLFEEIKRYPLIGFKSSD